MIRPQRSIVGLLVSTASTSFAAWLPAAFLADRAVRRASSHSVVGAINFASEEPRGLQAVCDRRSQTCTLKQGPPSRSSKPAMQQISCSDVGPRTPVEEGMAKQYNPAEVEERLYKWWEESGYFQPAESDDKQCFVISMPPPNVTGKLHMGHAMFVALEDIMARFARMRGNPTLWLPGTDHAGIATQMLVERALKAEGIERAELGREEFVERVWKWKREYGGYITGQIRRLGASCDWSREKFTLDPDLCVAVNEAFVTLYERGLIYKGEYMVNWSPSLRTAVSDLEVEYTEEEGMRCPKHFGLPCFLPIPHTMR